MSLSLSKWHFPLNGENPNSAKRKNERQRTSASYRGVEILSISQKK